MWQRVTSRILNIQHICLIGMLMSVCSVMPLHNAAMMFGLCRAHFCPLTALNQEHQLVTIFPNRQGSQLLWAILHQRQTVSTCLIIPLVNNGRVWDWMFKSGCHQNLYSAWKKKSQNEWKPFRDHQSRYQRWRIYHLIDPQRHLRICEEDDRKH